MHKTEFPENMTKNEIIQKFQDFKQLYQDKMAISDSTITDLKNENNALRLEFNAAQEEIKKLLIQNQKLINGQSNNDNSHQKLIDGTKKSLSTLNQEKGKQTSEKDFNI